MAGAVIAVLSVTLGAWLSVVTIGSGLLLLILGGWLLTGRDLAVRVPRAQFAVSDSFGGMTA